MEKKKIIIAGDTVPTSSNISLFSKSFTKDDEKKPFSSEIIETFSSADYSMLNLEAPLCNDSTPIKKSGPSLCAPEECAVGLKSLGVKLCSLANNHILDFGKRGLERTVKALSEQDIKTVGAGTNLEEAQKAHFFEMDMGEKKIRTALYSCCEHEFSYATANSAGANPFNPFESFDHVRELRKEADYIIVIFHGGKEYHPYPSPLLSKTCRKFVDCGADLVLCQHSHCIGCRETYKGKEILYGQGNFIFDSPEAVFFNGNKENKSVTLNNPWHSGLLVEVKLAFQDGVLESEINYIPTVKMNESIRLATADESSLIMEGFEKRSTEILIPGFIEDQFKNFAKSKLSSYISTFLGRRGKSFVFRAMNKLLGQRLRMNNYSDDDLLALKNCFQCESHREVILSALDIKD